MFSYSTVDYLILLCSLLSSFILDFFMISMNSFLTSYQLSILFFSLHFCSSSILYFRLFLVLISKFYFFVPIVSCFFILYLCSNQIGFQKICCSPYLFKLCNINHLIINPILPTTYKNHVFSIGILVQFYQISYCHL